MEFDAAFDEALLAFVTSNHHGLQQNFLAHFVMINEDWT